MSSVHDASAATAAASSSYSARTQRSTGTTAVAPSAASRSNQNQRQRAPEPPVNRDFSHTWGSDSLDDVSLTMPPISGGDTTEDGQYLSAFADSEFSSPSSYPSFVNPPIGEDPHARQAPGQPHQAAAASYPGSAAPPRRASACGRAVPAPSRSTTQLSASSVGESQNTLFTNDFGDEPLTSQSTQSSFADMPVSVTRRGTLAEDSDLARAAKRRRMPAVAAVNPAETTPLVLPLPSDEDDEDDDLFGEKENPPPNDDDLATIDLTEANDVPENLKKPEVDNRVKLSAFQCVICMDDVTTLTVTHCGKPPRPFNLFRCRRTSANYAVNRTFILPAVPALVAPRRLHARQVSHVPRENRHEGPGVV